MVIVGLEQVKLQGLHLENYETFDQHFSLKSSFAHIIITTTGLGL